MSDTPVTTPFDGLKGLLTTVEEDHKKAQEGNQAAGTRVRSVMQEVRKAAQVVRKEMLALREKARAEKPAKVSKPKA